MSVSRVDEVLEGMRAAGARITASRRSVVDALLSGPGHHVTAGDLLDHLRRDDPEFHESTVYRTLDLLVELSVITRIEADGVAVYHLAHRAHHHVVCDRCGRVFSVDPEVLAPVADQLRDDYDFVLRSDAVTLPGRCVDCVGPAVPATDDHRRLAHDH